MVMSTRVVNPCGDGRSGCPSPGTRTRPPPPEGEGVAHAQSRARWLNLPIVVLVRAYQVVLSPLMSGHCRFVPTCSEYALEACRVHPPHRALWLIAKRLGRCHPWGGAGGWDPVSEEETEGQRDRGTKGAERV